MFSNQRKNSGVSGLVAVSALMAMWLGVSAVMVTAYLHPEVREGSTCQLVCREPVNPPAHG